MKNLDELVDKKYRGLSPKALLKLPVSALKGVSEGDAKLLEESLQIRTIGDLASHWSVQNAQAIVTAAESRPPASGGTPELELDPRAATEGEAGGTTAPSYQLTYSSELMKNFKQATVMSPEEHFEALQTSTGLSMLFSISTDNVLYATVEQVGIQTGWTRFDLSSHTIAADFAGKSAYADTFATAQKAPSSSSAGGTIGLAMVVRETAGDHLYLSLGNSSSDTSWLSAVPWTAFPFDAPASPTQPNPAKVVIVGVYLSETTTGEYIVVDILRDSNAPKGLIHRYFIDPKKAGGHAWNSHDIGIDLEADLYTSALGRAAVKGSYGKIDGLYSLGRVDGKQQFIYTPIYNAFKPGNAAPVTRLQVPGNHELDAIAPCRRLDHATDLFVAADGGLYYFAAEAQKEVDGQPAVGVLLMQDPMLNGTTRLFAYTSGGRMVVFGLNGSNQVFYSACPLGQLTNASSWSRPLPILAGVNLLSPYLNVVNSGNTLFAASGEDLVKLSQCPDKLLWTSQKILLPRTSVRTKAQAFSSYTTQIQVLDGNNKPASKLNVQLTASSRGAFYINHLYYVLDNDPITVQTDGSGTLTLVEAVESLSARVLTVSLDGADSLRIDPMSKPMNKAANLNSADSLKNANIQKSDGSTQKLVGDGVSDTDLKAAATGISQLHTAYQDLSSKGTSSRAAAPDAEMSLEPRAAFDLGDAIEVAAGDLYQWLKTGVEHAIEIVKDAASDVWRAVVTIAGKVYHAILDAAEKVAGALEWVFNAIKAGIEKLIEYLMFLFEWQDITRTKNVLQSLVRLYVQDMIDRMDQIEEGFDEQIAKAQAAINNWAGITDWKGLGDAGSKPASSSTKANNADAPGGLLSHHFKNGVGDVVASALGGDSSGSSILQPLFDALDKEGQVLQDVYNQIYNIVKDFDSLSLEDILKKVVAILGDAVLGSTQVVIDALFEIAEALLKGAFEFLEAPIYVPVISDILEFFGVKIELSWLDLFCYMFAVPATLAYKIATGHAPFADDETVRTLINARSVADLPSSDSGASLELLPRALTGSSTGAAAPTSTASGLQKILQDWLPANVISPIFAIGHSVSGFCTLMLDFLDTFEVWEPTGENSFAIPSAILAIIGGVLGGIADYVGNKLPIKNMFVSLTNTGTLVVRIACKIGFAGPVQKKLGAGKLKFMAVADPRKIASMVDAVLVLPALICTCWHLGELAGVEASTERTVAILEETSNITAYVSRIAYTAAIWTPEDDEVSAAIKAAETAVMAIANIAYAGLQVAEVIVYLD